MAAVRAAKRIAQAGHPEPTSVEIALVPNQPKALANAWEAQLQLVKDTCCRPKSRDATDAEFGLFLHQCRTRRLDPLTRQIYAIFRNVKDGDRYVERMTIQTSIDGFRLTAQRTGEYRGQVGPFWCGEDGEWKDVWTAALPPIAAKVGAMREGFKEPVWGVARYDQYAQFYKDQRSGKEFPSGQWGKMPDTMTAKCAEALALRKAFPDELSGLYTGDEMQQADNHAEEQQPPEQPQGDQQPRRKLEPAQPPHRSDVPPASPKARLWTALIKWTGIKPSEVNDLNDARKRIYAFLEIPDDGAASTKDLERAVRLIVEQQEAGTDFAEDWDAKKKPAPKQQPLPLRVEISEEDLPF